MRVAVEVESRPVGSTEGPRWHELRVVTLGREWLSPELLEELERHRCGSLMGADYRLPACDGRTRVYTIEESEPEDVVAALEAWRKYREHTEATGLSGLQVKLLRELMSLHGSRHGHP